MSGFESLDADRFIRSIKDDATMQSLFPGGVVPLSGDFAARQPPDMHIVFSMVNDHDTNSIDGNRVFTAPTYSIEVVGKEIGYDVLRPVAERLDALLTARGGSRLIGGTWVSRFVRTNIIKRADRVDNVQWNYLGGVYETVAFSV